MTAPKPVRCSAPDCGRPLRSAKSRVEKIGPRCKAKLAAKIAVMEGALAGLSRDQKAKALALIGSGEVKATNRPGRYRVPSSDKRTTYLTTTDWCPCRATVVCAHMGAVRAIEAVRASATMRKAA
jgi:hypothetical protein